MTFHALVDLDGTITNPKPGIIASFRHALMELGLPAPEVEELLWVIGPPLRHSFPKLGVPADKIEVALEHYRAFYSAGAMFDAPVYAGMREALAALRESGITLVVATSKPHVMARPILEHFGLDTQFHAIHGAELDGRNDDKGDLLAHILAEEGVDPARAVMIGDRLFDVNAAKRHAIQAIGVLWGYGGHAELTEAGVTHLCETPHDLAALVERCRAAASR
ncbi:MAG: phosphoglycolate [Beijerinckiaceae bacterium]|nr:MAG: phosphoglycolate [Beijerinckiaceae bacterium]